MENKLQGIDPKWGNVTGNCRSQLLMEVRGRQCLVCLPLSVRTLCGPDSGTIPAALSFCSHSKNMSPTCFSPSIAGDCIFTVEAKMSQFPQRRVWKQYFIHLFISCKRISWMSLLGAMFRVSSGIHWGVITYRSCFHGILWYSDLFLVCLFVFSLIYLILLFFPL